MIRLEVVTPQGSILEADVAAVQLPGEAGEFGILPGHIAFLAALQTGVLSYRAGDTGASVPIAIGRGYTEINGHDKVVVLTQRARKIEAIDKAEVEREHTACRSQLDSWAGPTEGSGGADAAEHRLLRDTCSWCEAQLKAVKAKRASDEHP